ncbi:MAG: hypothetical protein ACLQGT_12910 [Terracidiphilus sp.]|jgi:hypothetical protein
MNRRVAHLLTRMYPRRWRERYGEEFENFLLEDRADLKTWMDVMRGAVGEHIHPTIGGAMSEYRTSFGTVVRQPSALIPLGMALTALAVVLGHVALYGAAREADEGAAAHIWQLLMVAQLPALLVFGIRWLPKAPKQAMGVLALLVAAILAAIAPVWFLHL